MGGGEGVCWGWEFVVCCDTVSGSEKKVLGNGYCVLE